MMHDNRKTIVVNATNMNEGGALTVLRSFIEAAQQYGNKMQWVFFVADSAMLKEYESPQIKFISRPKEKRSKLMRILWDVVGFKLYCYSHSIKPVGIISLQNTGVFYRNVSQYVYIHQILPFEREFKWKLFSKEQRLYFVNKYFMFWWMKFSIRKDYVIVVQTNWMKGKVVKYLHHDRSKVIISTPEISLNNNIKLDNVGNSKINGSVLFYPAAPYIYKNHDVIIRAIEYIIKEMKQNIDGIKIIFTIDGSENLYSKKIINMINSKGLNKYFELVGKLSYNDVLKIYCECNALLFPSYIETFGLPLIEAASFGIPILCADRPYSREVIGEYKGVTFIDYKDHKEWAKEMTILMGSQLRYEPYKQKNNNNGWKGLFDNILGVQRLNVKTQLEIEP